MTDQKPSGFHILLFPDGDLFVEHIRDEYECIFITPYEQQVLRKHLMRDVITELKKRVQETPYGCNEYIGGIETGLNIAISLIRGEK